MRYKAKLLKFLKTGSMWELLRLCSDLIEIVAEQYDALEKINTMDPKKRNLQHLELSKVALNSTDSRLAKWTKEDS